MKSFRRIFAYVWPQWPRVIVAVLSAIVVATLLSLSFMTVIPLLKVMMGEEGLHGWVERKISSQRYGIEFYVPEKVDFVSSDIAHHLLVTDVKDGSSIQEAGLEEFDQIIGVGDFLVEQDGQKIPSPKLLETLANAPENKPLTIQFRRSNADTGSTEVKTATFNTAAKLFYQNTATKWMKVLPREQTKENKTKAVIFIILLMGVVTIIRCIAKFFQGYMAQKIVLVGLNHLREDAFVHVMNVPIGFFADERPSDTVSRVINDTGVMGKAIKIMLGKALREPLNAMFMLGAAMWINWQLTLIFLCGGPLTIGLVVVFGRKMKKATGKSLAVWSQMLAKLQEAMTSLKVVKVYNQQDYERDRFKSINNRLLKQLLKISKIDALTSPVMEVVGMAAGSAALIFGAYWVINQGRMDGSEFLGLLILLGVAAESIRKTSDIWNKIQEANAASERVFGMMDTPVEVEAPGATELSPLKKRIEFRNIVFTYPGSDEAVLRGVNLSVEAGHNIAIVGPNGSGKTTLVNLITRFYDPDSGSILIDGQDIKKVTLKSLRSQIGMVTQNVVTFNDTIAANIAYGSNGSSRDQVIAAAKRSYSDEFITPLPDGYEAIIGEQGVGLSGGQLQRIIIARAILRDPAILIFDEATSQVDADSEAKIHNAIEEVMRDRTTFLIAHRFSTVISADVIVVMDKGRIIAQGQHSELIESCQLYQSLYETQLITDK